MSDPLKAKLFLEKFYEVKELVRTVEVDADDVCYRIEVYKHYTNPKTPFVASYFVQHKVPHPASQVAGETLDSFLLDTSLPWVAERTAEEALATALSFLGDRHPKRVKKIG